MSNTAARLDVASTDLAQARIDLAAAFRLAERFGFHEGIDNHFSLVVDLPDGRRGVLINPFGYHWSELTPRHLMLLDFDGNTIEGEGEVEATAFNIHMECHRAAPHAVCVLHTHMPYATAITMVEGGRLEPISQTSLNFYDRVGYLDDFGGLAHDADEGKRIASALKDNRVVFLANHGVMTVGDSAAKAFSDLYYLERAAQAQVLAHSHGGTPKRIPQDVAARTRDQFDDDAANGHHIKHFAALKRLLDRDAPGWDVL